MVRKLGSEKRGGGSISIKPHLKYWSKTVLSRLISISMKPNTVISKTFFFFFSPEVFITPFFKISTFLPSLSLMFRMKTSTETLVHRTEILFSQSAPASAFSEGFNVRTYISWFMIYIKEPFQSFLCFPTYTNTQTVMLWHFSAV